MDKLARRYGKQKISQVEPDLDSCRAGTIDFKRLHKLANENVIEVVGDCPEKEKRRNHNKRNQPAMGNERGLNIFITCSTALLSGQTSRNAQGLLPFRVLSSQIAVRAA